jgi:hypothetical protein
VTGRGEVTHDGAYERSVLVGAKCHSHDAETIAPRP